MMGRKQKTKFNNKYGKLNGICISNPPIIENAPGKIIPCLGMKTNYRTPPFDVTNKQFYVFNSLFPFDSEYSVYVPINEKIFDDSMLNVRKAPPEKVGPTSTTDLPDFSA